MTEISRSISFKRLQGGQRNINTISKQGLFRAEIYSRVIKYSSRHSEEGNRMYIGGLTIVHCAQYSRFETIQKCFSIAHYTYFSFICPSFNQRSLGETIFQEFVAHLEDNIIVASRLQHDGVVLQVPTRMDVLNIYHF